MSAHADKVASKLEQAARRPLTLADLAFAREALAALVADLEQTRAALDAYADGVARIAISSPPDDFDGDYEEWARNELAWLMDAAAGGVR